MSALCSLKLAACTLVFVSSVWAGCPFESSPSKSSTSQLSPRKSLLHQFYELTSPSKSLARYLYDGADFIHSTIGKGNDFTSHETSVHNQVMHSKSSFATSQRHLLDVQLRDEFEVNRAAVASRANPLSRRKSLLHYVYDGLSVVQSSSQSLFKSPTTDADPAFIPNFELAEDGEQGTQSSLKTAVLSETSIPSPRGTCESRATGKCGCCTAGLLYGCVGDCGGSDEGRRDAKEGFANLDKNEAVSLPCSSRSTGECGCCDAGFFYGCSGTCGSIPDGKGSCGSRSSDNCGCCDKGILYGCSGTCGDVVHDQESGLRGAVSKWADQIIATLDYFDMPENSMKVVKFSIRSTGLSKKSISKGDELQDMILRTSKNFFTSKSVTIAEELGLRDIPVFAEIVSIGLGVYDESNTYQETDSLFSASRQFSESLIPLPQILSTAEAIGSIHKTKLARSLPSVHEESEGQHTSSLDEPIAFEVVMAINANAQIYNEVIQALSGETFLSPAYGFDMKRWGTFDSSSLRLQDCDLGGCSMIHVGQLSTVMVRTSIPMPSAPLSESTKHLMKLCLSATSGSPIEAINITDFSQAGRELEIQANIGVAAKETVATVLEDFTLARFNSELDKARLPLARAVTAFQCLPCSWGFYTDGNCTFANQTRCFPCKSSCSAGQYMSGACSGTGRNDTIICLPCQSASNSTNCSSGYYSSGNCTGAGIVNALQCLKSPDCTAGYGASGAMCFPCIAGYYSTGGSLGCRPCPPGTSSRPGAAACNSSSAGNSSYPSGNISYPGGNSSYPGGIPSYPGGNFSYPGGNSSYPGGNSSSAGNITNQNTSIGGPPPPPVPTFTTVMNTGRPLTTTSSLRSTPRAASTPTTVTLRTTSPTTINAGGAGRTTSSLRPPPTTTASRRTSPPLTSTARRTSAPLTSTARRTSPPLTSTARRTSAPLPRTTSRKIESSTRATSPAINAGGASRRSSTTRPPPTTSKAPGPTSRATSNSLRTTSTLRV